jgi:hypothetical protein
MGRTSTSITVLFLGLLLSGTVPATEHEGKRARGMEMMKKRTEGKEGGMMAGMHGHRMSYAHAVLAHAEDLKLSDEQMGKIVRIELTHRKEHQAIMERMHKSMHAAHRGLMDPAADLAGIRKASKDHSQAHEDMVKDKIKAREEIHAVPHARATRSAQVVDETARQENGGA